MLLIAVSRSKRRFQVLLIEHRAKYIVLLLGAVQLYASKQVAMGVLRRNTLTLPSSPILLYMVSGRDCTTPRLCVTSTADLHYVRSLSDCWCCMRSSGCHKVSIVNILRAGSSINVHTVYSRPASDLCTRGRVLKKKEVKYRGRRPS